MIMGIDISSKTGVALVNDAGEVVSATEFEFKKVSGLQRASLLGQAVASVALANRSELELIVIEGYGYANQYTLATLVEIGTVVRYFLWQEDLPYLEVAPTSLKKFVTGSGVAKKNIMMLEVYKQFGYSASTDNIADAVGLAMFGLCCLGRGEFNKTSKTCCEEVLKKQVLPRLAINCK